jgi:alpha-L-arabinofuranosidase
MCGREVVLSVTNRHLAETVDVQVTIPRMMTPVAGDLKVLTARNVRDYNDAQHPCRVCPETVEFASQDSCFILSLRPYSVNTLRLTFPIG